MSAFPATLDALLTLAEDMTDGLHTHEVAVGVKQNLEVPVRVTIADSNGKAFIATARSVLEPSSGRSHRRRGSRWVSRRIPSPSPARRRSGRCCSGR